MFFRKKEPSHSVKLIDIVKKTNKTGYVFGNISNDLGGAAERIMKSPPLIIMAYGYARRAAAAALYIQGVFDKDTCGHVTSIFKSLQAQTGHTVEFQEMAASHSVEFMQTYSNSINGLFIKKIVSISLQYEISGKRIADENLFQSVVETIYAEEMELQQKQIIIMKSNILEKPDIKTIDITDEKRIDEVISELQKISDQKSKKEVTMMICPIDEPWSYEFYFSDDELNLAHVLTDELHHLMQFKVSMPLFAYQEK